MDIFAHALWVGAGATLLKRKKKISSRTRWWTIALTVAPDIPLFIPVLLWSLSPSGSFKTFYDYIFTTPENEPSLPSTVVFISHHLHCVMHSMVIVAAVTFLTWFYLKRFFIPLAGWWIHILIDIFTHSKEYYAVPIFYPFSEEGFNGIAWISPKFLMFNYVLIACAYLWLFLNRKDNKLVNKQKLYKSHIRKR